MAGLTWLCGIVVMRIQPLQDCLRLLDCSTNDLGGRQNFVNQTNRFAGDDRGGLEIASSAGREIAGPFCLRLLKEFAFATDPSPRERVL